MFPRRRGQVRAAGQDPVPVPVPCPVPAPMPRTGLARLIADAVAGEPLTGWAAQPIPANLALSVPAVRRGMRVITSAIAKMPLQRWRDKELLPPGTMLEQPEVWRPYVATMTATVQDLVFYPYAWWRVIARDWQNYPSRVMRLDPAYVQVETVYESGEVARVFVTYQGKEVPDRELIRFDGPDAGVLRLGSGEILTALALEMAASRYASPKVPEGILKNISQHELTRPEILTLLDDWEQFRRERQTAFLSGGLDYINPAGNARDMQLVEAREECALQIARVMSLAPRYVNATSGDSMTYTNSTAERRDLIDFTLAAYIGAIEQRLSMPDQNGTPRGQSVRFNMDVFLRGNPAERAALYQVLIPLGVMTVDEAREQEDLAPAAPKPAAPEPAAPAEPAAPEQPEPTPAGEPAAQEV